MTAAGRFAEFISDTVELPSAAREAAFKAVFDLIAASVAGYTTRSAGAARKAVEVCWGGGPAAIWFSGRKSTINGAAFANAASACAQDLDDGHRAAAGHPGAAIIPAVLAHADINRTAASRIATAIGIGYEVGIRISAARGISKLATTDSGLWCGQGVAAAHGWLRGLAPREIMHAIVIAGTTAPSQSATAYTHFMGNQVKEGIPWAVSNGMLAVELARAGFTGPIDMLDFAERYDQAILLAGLGTAWQVETTYFKPYACCRWIHAALDAFYQIQSTHQIRPSDIQSIEVETFGRALTLNNEPEPKTLESAQYSIPFCIGVAGWLGPSAFLPLEEQVLTDPHIVALSRKVTIATDPSLDKMFSAAVPARVRVRMARDCFTQEVLTPKGEPANAMDWQDIEAKFLAVAAGRLTVPFRNELGEAIASLATGDVKALLTALGTPAFASGNASLSDAGHYPVGEYYP